MNHITQVCVGRLLFAPGITNICVPITGRTSVEIIEQTKKIKGASPDIVEWRGDFYEDIMDFQKAAQMAETIQEILVDIPLLFTFRSQNEGGNRKISVYEYAQLNQVMAASAHIQMIDVEVYMEKNKMRELIAAIHESGKPVIGSHHRFDCTPSREDMIDILENIEAAGADILKLAVMPQKEEDVENLIAATKEAVTHQVTHPVVTMSMGTLGVRTRVEGKRFGSSMTFGCVGETSAPGQLEIEELRAAMARVKM